MTIFGHLFASDRLLDSPEAWMPIISQTGGMRSAGVTVNNETSLTLSSYFACLNVLATDLGKMPFDLINSKTKELASGQSNLMEEPNPYLTGQSFRELLTHWAAGWGKGIAEIERDGAGRPARLWPIHPSRVQIIEFKGRPIYRVFGNDNGYVDFEDRDIFSVHGMGGNGYEGYSVAKYGSGSIGLGLAANEFASGYFKNGGGVNIVIKLSKQLSPEAKQAMRDSWASKHSGPGNTGRPLQLDPGTEIERFDIPANEAQMLETRQFQVEEVARWFRISPVKIGHNLNVPFANLEATNKQHLDDALMPWIVRFEKEADRKLLFGKKFTYQGRVIGLMRGDTNARASYYRSMQSTASMSPNDIRTAEGMPTVNNPAMDAYYMQGAMATIDQIHEGKNKPNAEKPQGEPGRPTRDEASAMLSPLIGDVVQRCAAKEASALSKKAKLKDADATAYAGWLMAFRDSQVGYLADMLVPVVQSTAHLGDLSEVCQALTEQYAAQSLPWIHDVGLESQLIVETILQELYEG